VPELPDIELYLHALRRRVDGGIIERVRLGNPFIVRTYDPPVSVVEQRTIRGLSRLGKRLVFDLGDELFVVLHLMIAGRLRWRERGAPIPGKVGLAAFDFSNGSLVLTEAGSKRQASIHVVRSSSALAEHDPGGLDVREADLRTFTERLGRENHTLKRALTDPRIFSGIGNAYSDEILHAARLSPMKQTAALTDEEIERLFHATQGTLAIWVRRLQEQAGDDFPDKVTAFHAEMAVHGKFGKPCPACGEPVQRIVFATNEANYCSGCQTGGKLLSDRALSRLLGADWPKTLEEMETRKRSAGTMPNREVRGEPVRGRME
jgi:formamidopyrimidine-DNA glycosylase